MAFLKVRRFTTSGRLSVLIRGRHALVSAAQRNQSAFLRKRERFYFSGRCFAELMSRRMGRMRLGRVEIAAKLTEVPGCSG